MVYSVVEVLDALSDPPGTVTVDHHLGIREIVDAVRITTGFLPEVGVRIRKLLLKPTTYQLVFPRPRMPLAPTLVTKHHLGLSTTLMLCMEPE